MQCTSSITGSKFEKVHHPLRHRLATNLSFAAPRELTQAQTHRNCAWGGARCTALMVSCLCKWIGGCKPMKKRPIFGQSAAPFNFKF
jgi:hypothetical protein